MALNLKFVFFAESIFNIVCLPRPRRLSPRKIWNNTRESRCKDRRIIVIRLYVVSRKDIEKEEVKEKAKKNLRRALSSSYSYMSMSYYS